MPKRLHLVALCHYSHRNPPHVFHCRRKLLQVSMFAFRYTTVIPAKEVYSRSQNDAASEVHKRPSLAGNQMFTDSVPCVVVVSA